MIQCAYVCTWVRTGCNTIRDGRVRQVDVKERTAALLLDVGSSVVPDVRVEVGHVQIASDHHRLPRCQIGCIPGPSRF